MTAENYEYRENLSIHDDYETMSSIADIVPDDAIEWNGHWYKLYDIDIDSWEEAKSYCEEKGGYLATITSEAENEFVYNDVLLKAGGNCAYFGLYDLNGNNNWAWVTGEKVDYLNWASGEPSSADEHYGMYYYLSQFKDGEWNDARFGDGTKSFICEWGR